MTIVAIELGVSRVQNLSTSQLVAISIAVTRSSGMFTVQLFCPPVLISFWNRTVIRTTMPKTSINEDGEFLLGKAMSIFERPKGSALGV